MGGKQYSFFVRPLFTERVKAMVRGRPLRQPWLFLSRCQKRKPTPTRGDRDPAEAAPSAVSTLRQPDSHRSRTSAQTNARPTTSAGHSFNSEEVEAARIWDESVGTALQTPSANGPVSERSVAECSKIEVGLLILKGIDGGANGNRTERLPV